MDICEEDRDRLGKAKKIDSLVWADYITHMYKKPQWSSLLGKMHICQ